MPEPKIHEFIVLRQNNAHMDMLPILKAYDREAKKAGALQAQHFKIFHALPQPDPTPAYTMVYQWAGRSVIPSARDHIIRTKALAELLNSSQITAFALTEQIEGDLFEVSLFSEKPDHVLELAIRRIREGRESDFDTHRKVFVANLQRKVGVLASYELKAVLGQDIERRQVGLTIYESRAQFEELAAEILAAPATSDYFSTFDVEALKYAVAI